MLAEMDAGGGGEVHLEEAALDEIHFVDDPLAAHALRIEVLHHRGLQLAGVSHAAGVIDSRISETLSASAVQRSDAQSAPVRTLTSLPATAR